MNRALLQDLAWALLIGAVVGVSPHVPGDRLDLRVVAGIAAAVALGALAPLGWRPPVSPPDATDPLAPGSFATDPVAPTPCVRLAPRLFIICRNEPGVSLGC